MLLLSQQQSSPGILECLVIVNPLLHQAFPLLEGWGSIPIHTKHASQRRALKLHELFLQVRNGVRRRKRRCDPAFGGAGNVGGTCRFESCRVMLAESWVLKSRHAELSKAPGLELFGSYITCGKNPQLTIHV